MPLPPFSNILTAYDLRSAHGWNVLTVATTITSPDAACSWRISDSICCSLTRVDHVGEVVDRRRQLGRRRSARSRPCAAQQARQPGTSANAAIARSGGATCGTSSRQFPRVDELRTAARRRRGRPGTAAPRSTPAADAPAPSASTSPTTRGSSLRPPLGIRAEVGVVSPRRGRRAAPAGAAAARRPAPSRRRAPPPPTAGRRTRRSPRAGAAGGS